LVILGKRNGNLVYLKDVARIEDSFKEVTSIARVNRKQGIVMMVQKQIGTNTVKVPAWSRISSNNLRVRCPRMSRS